MDAWIREREGPVTFVTLVRPPINTLDRKALDELAEIVGELESNPEARAVVITGGIDEIFCSGGDLKYWRQIRDGRQVSSPGREVFARIERLPKPTLAAINGHVIGDGLALALACDLRIASEAATFRLPEVGYGFIPGWGLIHRLVDLVGRASAFELLLTGQLVASAQARMIGLVHDVVPPDRLRDHVLGRARDLAARSPAAIWAAKRAIQGGDEAACFASVWGEADWQAGIDALLNKRIPVFGSDGKGGENYDLGKRIQTGRAAGWRDRCR